MSEENKVDDELNFLNLKGMRFRMELLDSQTGEIVDLIETTKVKPPILINIDYEYMET